MKNINLVMKKELYRVFSDRKLIISLFIVPAIIMIAIYSLMGVLVIKMSEDIEQHVSVVYIVNATDDLKAVMKAADYESGADVAFLTESEYEAKKGEIETDLMEGMADLIVVLDREFDSKYAAYKGSGDAIPNVNIFYNSTEDYSNQAYSVFSMVLDGYRTVLLDKRLGNLELLSVFNQQDNEIVKESKAGTQFIAMMLPYMIMIMLFSGAMSISVDAFAGEKERGTLASMLVSPVRRTDIVMGKIIALAIVAALSSMVYAISMIVAMSIFGTTMSGMDAGMLGGLKFTPVQVLQLGLMLIVLDYLFVAAIALLSSFAKDIKTASTYVTPAYMVVLVCALMTMFSTSGKTETAQYAIPLYGNALAIQDICTGELGLAGFFASFGATFALAALITVALAKIFDSDKLMFNA